MRRWWPSSIGYGLQLPSPPSQWDKGKGSLKESWLFSFDKTKHSLIVAIVIAILDVL